MKANYISCEVANSQLFILHGESNSIKNQNAILKKYAEA